MRVLSNACPNWVLPLALCAAVCGTLSPARASNLDTIGVTLLRTVKTNLNGAGIRVAQPEAQVSTNPPSWQVSPAAGGASRPVGLLTYTCSAGSTNAFPNSLGAESGHADSVAAAFYGIPDGVATNVAHVDNEDAGYFVNEVFLSVNQNQRVVNQSFIASTDPAQIRADERTWDPAYDNYAAKYGTLFVSGVGNGSPVSPPSTCYNGLGVAAFGGSSSVGPTLDNGRCKPDITAPSSVTSFSTPQVAGAAAVLMQAALGRDGGSDTNSAADLRTIKALLLNGAIKPSGWTNSASSPLDARYGAGVLNVFNSYEQLAGGKQTNYIAATVSLGNAHPPTGATNTVSALSGWNLGTISSSSTLDGVHHYFFNAANGLSNALFTATATLVWNRQQNKTNINNLDLFLYNASTGGRVACSTSIVDNVEHLFVNQLPAGRYDLQVLKQGGATVSNSETYAVAFELFSLSVNLAGTDANMVLTWPIYPAGFVLESTTNLASSAAWTTNNPSPVITNGQNRVVWGVSGGDQLFRLRRP